MPKLEYLHGGGAVSVQAIAEPSTPAAGSSCLFLDSADGHYKIKRSDGAVIDLEAAGEGGGGSGNFAEAAVVLDGALLYKATVTGQAWVTPTSRLVASVYADPVSGTTVEMLAIAGLVVTLANRTEGVGFDVYVYNPNGLTGTVTIHIVGG